MVQCAPCHCQASQPSNGLDFQSLLLCPLITVFRAPFSVVRCCQAAPVPLTWGKAITEFPKPCFVHLFWAICLTFKLNSEFFLYLAFSLMPSLSLIFYEPLYWPDDPHEFELSLWVWACLGGSPWRVWSWWSFLFLLFQQLQTKIKNCCGMLAWNWVWSKAIQVKVECCQADEICWSGKK